MTGQTSSERSPDQKRSRRAVIWFAVLLGALLLARALLAYTESRGAAARGLIEF